MTYDGTHVPDPGQPGKTKATLQLSRLETLSDVVFALVLWRLFTLIPIPDQEEWGWRSIGEFFQDELTTFISVAIGLAFTIIYWIQSNALLGDLERTDVRHTVLAILQLFMLLVFLSIVGLSVSLEPSTGMRALESGATALVGIAGSLAYRYAIKDRRLLRDDVSDEEAVALADRVSAEPLTAMCTLALAPFPIVWELTWFSYPLMIRLVRRRRVKKEGG